MSIAPFTTRSLPKSMSPNTLAMVFDADWADWARRAAASRCCAAIGNRRTGWAHIASRLLLAPPNRSAASWKLCCAPSKSPAFNWRSATRASSAPRVKFGRAAAAATPKPSNARTAAASKPPPTAHSRNAWRSSRHSTASKVMRKIGTIPIAELTPKCQMLPSRASTWTMTPSTAARITGRHDPGHLRVHGAVEITTMLNETVATIRSASIHVSPVGDGPASTTPTPDTTRDPHHPQIDGADIPPLSLRVDLPRILVAPHGRLLPTTAILSSFGQELRVERDPGARPRRAPR